MENKKRVLSILMMAIILVASLGNDVYAISQSLGNMGGEEVIGEVEELEVHKRPENIALVNYWISLNGEKLIELRGLENSKISFKREALEELLELDSLEVKGIGSLKEGDELTISLNGSVDKERVKKLLEEKKEEKKLKLMFEDSVRERGSELPVKYYEYSLGDVDQLDILEIDFRSGSLTPRSKYFNYRRIRSENNFEEDSIVIGNWVIKQKEVRVQINFFDRSLKDREIDLGKIPVVDAPELEFSESGKPKDLELKFALKKKDDYDGAFNSWPIIEKHIDLVSTNPGNFNELVISPGNGNKEYDLLLDSGDLEDSKFKLIENEKGHYLASETKIPEPLLTDSIIKVDLNFLLDRKWVAGDKEIKINYINAVTGRPLKSKDGGKIETRNIKLNLYKNGEYLNEKNISLSGSQFEEELGYLIDNHRLVSYKLVYDKKNKNDSDEYYFEKDGITEEDARKSIENLLVYKKDEKKDGVYKPEIRNINLYYIQRSHGEEAYTPRGLFFKRNDPSKDIIDYEVKYSIGYGDKDHPEKENLLQKDSWELLMDKYGWDGLESEDGWIKSKGYQGSSIQLKEDDFDDNLCLKEAINSGYKLKAIEIDQERYLIDIDSRHRGIDYLNEKLKDSQLKEGMKIELIFENMKNEPYEIYYKYYDEDGNLKDILPKVSSSLPRSVEITIPAPDIAGYRLVESRVSDDLVPMEPPKVELPEYIDIWPTIEIEDWTNLDTNMPSLPSRPDIDWTELETNTPMLGNNPETNMPMLPTALIKFKATGTSDDRIHFIYEKLEEVEDEDVEILSKKINHYLEDQLYRQVIIKSTESSEKEIQYLDIGGYSRPRDNMNLDFSDSDEIDLEYKRILKAEKLRSGHDIKYEAVNIDFIDEYGNHIDGILESSGELMPGKYMVYKDHLASFQAPAKLKVEKEESEGYGAIEERINRLEKELAEAREEENKYIEADIQDGEEEADLDIELEDDLQLLKDEIHDIELEIEALRDQILSEDEEPDKEYDYYYLVDPDIKNIYVDSSTKNIKSLGFKYVKIDADLDLINLSYRADGLELYPDREIARLIDIGPSPFSSQEEDFKMDFQGYKFKDRVSSDSGYIFNYEEVDYEEANLEMEEYTEEHILKDQASAFAEKKIKVETSSNIAIRPLKIPGYEFIKADRDEVDKKLVYKYKLIDDAIYGDLGMKDFKINQRRYKIRNSNPNQSYNTRHDYNYITSYINSMDGYDIKIDLKEFYDNEANWDPNYRQEERYRDDNYRGFSYRGYREGDINDNMNLNLPLETKDQISTNSDVTLFYAQNYTSSGPGGGGGSTNPRPKSNIQIKHEFVSSITGKRVNHRTDEYKYNRNLRGVNIEVNNLLNRYPNHYKDRKIDKIKIYRLADNGDKQELNFENDKLMIDLGLNYNYLFEYHTSGDITDPGIPKENIKIYMRFKDQDGKYIMAGEEGYDLQITVPPGAEVIIGLEEVKKEVHDKIMEMKVNISEDRYEYEGIVDFEEEFYRFTLAEDYSLEKYFIDLEYKEINFPEERKVELKHIDSKNNKCLRSEELIRAGKNSNVVIREEEIEELVARFEEIKNNKGEQKYTRLDGSSIKDYEYYLNEDKFIEVYYDVNPDRYPEEPEKPAKPEEPSVRPPIGGGGDGRPEVEDLEEETIEINPEIDDSIITGETKDIEKLLDLKNHNSYIKGYPDKTVRPEENITREEAAVIFYRILNSEFRDYIKTDKHNFTDLDDGRWSLTEIASLDNAGIIEGYPDGSFRPVDKMTRAELVTMAARFDTLDPKANSKLNDIDGHWAEADIRSAVNKGWIEGYPDGSFRPDKTISRAEFVTIVNKILLRKVSKENMLEGRIEFPDLEEFRWYYESMQEAINSHKYSRLEGIEEVWTELIN